MRESKDMCMEVSTDIELCTCMYMRSTCTVHACHVHAHFACIIVHETNKNSVAEDACHTCTYSKKQTNYMYMYIHVYTCKCVEHIRYTYIKFYSLIVNAC